MPSRVIVAYYNLASSFRVPKDVPLLSSAENDKCGGIETPWSWWIKWDTLHYIDDKGVEHSIEPYCAASDCDYKRPANVEEEEDESDDDE